MILALLLDRTSFLLELVPYAQPFPSTAQRLGEHTLSKILSCPFIISNFPCCAPPHLILCQLCACFPIHCIPGELQLFCELCLFKRHKDVILSCAISLLGQAAHQCSICLAGTWNSFPSPPMPAQTSCLRRVPITLTQRWYQNVVQPCSLEPESLLF